MMGYILTLFDYYIIPMLIIVMLFVLMASLELLARKHSKVAKLFYIEEDDSVKNKKQFIHIDLDKPLSKNSIISTMQHKVWWGVTPIMLGTLISLALSGVFYVIGIQSIVKDLGYIQSFIIMEIVMLTITTPISMLILLYYFKGSFTLRKIEDGVTYIKVRNADWIKYEEGI